MDEEKRLAELHQILDATVEFLNADELEVLTEIAQRIVRGQKTYGYMDLDELDGRDLLVEADEEDDDWIVYRIMHSIKERRARKDRA